jgi:hypothetical protein
MAPVANKCAMLQFAARFSVRAWLILGKVTSTLPLQDAELVAPMVKLDRGASVWAPGSSRRVPYFRSCDLPHTLRSRQPRGVRKYQLIAGQEKHQLSRIRPSAPPRNSTPTLGFGGLGINFGYKGTMHIQSRFILAIAALAFALASGLSNEVSADGLKEAKVTQVIQDVRMLPSNASPRPAAVNDNVRQGTAVQTGVQSRSELTFKDQTITRLGEKTIFSVGEGPRTIDLGSGQFLLYAPKKAGGAKVKAGPVTAAITG